MAFLGLSLITWQTLLIIGFPFIYGSLSRICGFLGFIRKKPLSSTDQASSSSSPSKSSSKPPNKVELRKVIFKPQSFLLVSLLLIHSIYFLTCNPSQTNPFSLTRQQLNVPSTTLSTALDRYYRAKGLRDSPLEQQRLIKKLNTLDARLLYATVGPDAFLHCSWCKPPSSKNSSIGLDHLFFTLSRLGLVYSLFFISLGLMTTAAKQVNAKRRVWRTRLALLSFVYGILETSFLTLMVYVPSLMSSMGLDRMVWDALFLPRFLFLSLMLTCAWWTTVSEPPIDPLSPVSKLGLGVASIAAEIDGLVNRLRLTALQRSTIMRDGNHRAQINQFWENAESQARLAGVDETVEKLKDGMGLSLRNPEHREQLKSWIDQLYPDPTSSHAHPFPASI